MSDPCAQARSGPDDRAPDLSYRALIWGPANFTGMPPRGLVLEGAVLGLGGSGLIVGLRSRVR